MSHIKSYKLKNRNNIIVTLLNYGAIIQSVKTCEGDELVLGFRDPEQYKHNPYFFGATIGRVANRIAGGQFTCQGKTYLLERNENKKHCLHSAHSGLHQVFWTVASRLEKNKIEFQYNSAANEVDFPANVEIKVSYELTDNNELIIDYTAITDMVTPLDLTNHTYWNLSGKGNILDHEIKFDADYYLELTSDLIPTGKIIHTKNTPFDFFQYKTIGQDIDRLIATKGYNHYFIVNHYNQRLRRAAIIKEKQSNRTLTVLTTQRGFQFYTGNFLKGHYPPYGGFCIETQNYPNAVNQLNFPSPLLLPNERYQERTIYRLCQN